MTPDIDIREMTEADIEPASALIVDAFNRAIAPHYTRQGVQEFLRYAAPAAMAERAKAGHFGLVAWAGEEMAGVAEVRDSSHVAMLFVAPGMQRSGVGRRLLARIVELCRERSPGLDALTLHASPNSVTAYDRFGFAATGPEQNVNGIRFTPMSLPLT